jgi:hypothetical protein
MMLSARSMMRTIEWGIARRLVPEEGQGGKGKCDGRMETVRRAAS